MNLDTISIFYPIDFFNNHFFEEHHYGI